jgi:hypothetical protein
MVCSQAKGETLYHDDFRDHYPTRGRRFKLSRYQLEAPVVAWDQDHLRKITVSRTRGDKYGYDQQKCVITIEGEGLKRPRSLSVLDFRTVDGSWITAKLVLIKLDIGHVAGVEAIYDVEKDKIVYCESLSYIIGIEPGGAANGSQPFRSETNSTPSAAGSRPSP